MTRMIRILLVEDNKEYANAVKLILGEVSAEAFDLVHVTRVADGLKQLGKDAFEVILLDLNLPDSAGYETFATVHTFAPDLHIYRI